MINMRNCKQAGVAVCTALLLGLASAAAHADETATAGSAVNITANGDSIKAAGATVTIGGKAEGVGAAGALVDLGVTTTGDVKVVGAKVTFAGSVGHDLDVFGASVDLKGHVANELRVGGAVVDLSVSTGGALRGGGATFTVSPTSDIGGELTAGGAVISIGGHVAGKVTIGGARVLFDARADGPVDITGDTIVIGPNARIGGELTIRSPNDPKVDTAATITGPITRAAMPRWSPEIPWLWSVALAAAIAVSTMLAGLVLLIFGGRVFAASVLHVRHRPLSSFLFGILTVVLVPFIAIVLMATVVGIPIGFAILFIMPFLFVFGHAVAAAGIASGLLLRRPAEAGAVLSFVMLVIGALILAALGFIPFVGPLIVCIAVVLGVGAFTRTLGHRLRRSDAAPAS